MMLACIMYTTSGIIQGTLYFSPITHNNSGGPAFHRREVTCLYYYYYYGICLITMTFCTGVVYMNNTVPPMIISCIKFLIVHNIWSELNLQSCIIIHWCAEPAHTQPLKGHVHRQSPPTIPAVTVEALAKGTLYAALHRFSSHHVFSAGASTAASLLMISNTFS